MLGLDALELARIQFAFTVSFHIIFPAITIGLASYLAVLEGLWLKTHNEAYRELYHFWSKIFAVNFGMGVVSGLVMAYQFGTNWSFFSEFAGSITGPLLTYEVLTAFFLEAGFLGVMLFGWNRVGPGLHFFATCMVALGTLISTFWITASNSWMQTPQGHEIINGGGAGRLAEGDLQPVLPVPPAAHVHRSLPLLGVLRRRLRRTAPAARPRHPGDAQDAVDGDVDGADRRAGAGADRRCARTEYAETPAGEDRRH